MPVRRSRGCLTNVFGLVLFAVVLVYGVVGIMSPWAFHIGGRWTPLLYWEGRGTLVTEKGAYPLYVFFYPSSSMSRLRVDNLQPTGGVQGSAAICLSPGQIQSLKVSGTIFGGWRSTEKALMEFRLLDWKIIDMGQRQGYFDLYGRWRGGELIMDNRDGFGALRSGLRFDKAAVTFSPANYAEFEYVCVTSRKLS